MSTEHQPAPHADRDGSERRRSMEREHERGLAADVAEPASQPCRTVGYIAGEPFAFLFWGCPDCGHSRMLHPGRHNPKIESCVLCRLVDAVEPKAAG